MYGDEIIIAVDFLNWMVQSESYVCKSCTLKPIQLLLVMQMYCRFAVVNFILCNSCQYSELQQFDFDNILSND